MVDLEGRKGWLSMGWYGLGWLICQLGVV